MALAIIFISLFFILGVLLGPLLLAGLIAGLDDDRGSRLAKFAVGLGLKSVWKPVLTFTSQDDLTLKRRSFDEQHDSEYVSFGGVLGGVKRYLQDPMDRFHPCYGTPLGFVDELFGVVVDPRDVTLGAELRREQANSQYTHRVERSSGYRESVKAAFEVPRGQVGVQLSQAATLFGGSFDSQLVDRIRKLYQTSQAPKSDTSALQQLLVPVIAFVGVVLLSMFVAGQTGGGGGGGGPAPAPSQNNTTVQIGSSLMLLFISTSGIVKAVKDRYAALKQKLGGLRSDDDEEEKTTSESNDGPTFSTKIRSTVAGVLQGNWRDRAVIGTVATVGLLVCAVLYFAFPPWISLLGISLPLGIWSVIALGVGMLVPGFVASFFGRSLGPVGMGLGKLYIVIGLLGFDKPVIDFDGDRYELVEYDSKDWSIEPHWYRFAMTRIGVGFPNDEEVWPDGTTLKHEEVESLADTGKTRNAPDDCVTTDAIEVDDIKGHLPDNPDKDAVHVRTDRTTGWFFEAGQARRLMMIALQNAKRDFGGGQKPVGEKWLLLATLGSIALASVFSWAVFFA